MIETERLILRQWRAEDFAPFGQMNADPVVMEYFPKLLSREESDGFAAKFKGLIEKNGWGLFAVEIKETGEFIGFVGLNPVDYDTPFTPAVEIAWRLARPYWGKGYATEAAQAALRYGFETLGLAEIVAFTTEQNSRSRAVMERLGMERDPEEDFDHPKLPAGHPLLRHVLYRLKRRSCALQGERG